MEKCVIETKGLTKRYGSVTPLDRMDLRIREGEWVSVMGPSGSGKTTLLNILSFLDVPTEGEYRLAGVDVSTLSEKERVVARREKIGLIFQQFHLIPYLTALENVMLAQYYHSLSDAGEAGAMLEMVGLGHRAGHLPSQLSGGEQQRVCIARALINDPVLILADEPTGSLDQENEGVVMDLFKKLHARGHTLVVVTHDVDVGRMAERRIVLSHGHMVSPHPTLGAEEQYTDELLELLEKNQEAGGREGAADGALPPFGGLTQPLLHRMEQEGLVAVSGGRVALTETGAEAARERVRRHRLAEALFMGVLDQGPNQGQEAACQFEHLLSPSMADGICAFLRHPKTCPHGKPIPPGRCCGNASRES
ncbi:MAG: ATP-binding cassette domain-containing protein [Elusimicrobia bacterium]|nr:ATP-binding cassette domain-containing protein [Elusimicrobiota bacterium]